VQAVVLPLWEAHWFFSLARPSAWSPPRRGAHAQAHPVPVSYLVSVYGGMA
jgi:hypothetical protein